MKSEIRYSFFSEPGNGFGGGRVAGAAQFGESRGLRRGWVRLYGDFCCGTQDQHARRRIENPAQVGGLNPARGPAPVSVARTTLSATPARPSSAPGKDVCCELLKGSGKLKLLKKISLLQNTDHAINN